LFTRTILSALAVLALSAPALAADGFTIAPRGTVQFDIVALEDSQLPPGFHISTGGSFRRIRIGVAGQLAENWLYDFTPRLDTASFKRLAIANAFIQYDGFAPFHLKVGAFSQPANVDDTTSSAETLFLERAQPSDLSRGLTSGTGRAAASVFAYEQNYFASLTLAGGLLSDAPGRQGAIVSRAAWRAWHDADTNIAIAANVTHLFSPPQTGATHDIRLRSRPEFSGQTVDLRLIDTGNLDAKSVTDIGLETAGTYGSFYGQAGIFHFMVDRAPPALQDPTFSGWYVQASWVLTGEARAWRASRGSFAAPEPAQAFGDGGWGAFEIAARYSGMNLDSRAGLAGTAQAVDAVRGGRQTIASIGLSWYPNDTLRFVLDYQHVDVARLNGAGGSLDARVDLLSLRSQISF
jgi:phosphate-selective porin OprO/OprP